MPKGGIAALNLFIKQTENFTSTFDIHYSIFAFYKRRKPNKTLFNALPTASLPGDRKLSVWHFWLNLLLYAKVHKILLLEYPISFAVYV
jgi:hypothetical protein